MRRATADLSPSAPTVSRARMGWRRPELSRTRAPTTDPLSRSSSARLVRSRTEAPAARALRTRARSRTRRETDSPVGRYGRYRVAAKRPCAVAPRTPVTFIPSRGAAPSCSNAATTPSRSSMRTASGLRYSAQAFSRGNSARSTATTEYPAPASSAAVALPAGPAPATRTSTCSGQSITKLPGDPRRGGSQSRRQKVYSIVVQPGPASDPLGCRSTAVHLPFTGLAAPGTMKAPLGQATEGGIHNHPEETYQRSQR